MKQRNFYPIYDGLHTTETSRRMQAGRHNPILTAVLYIWRRLTTAEG